MRYIFILLAFLFSGAFCADMLDADYQFLEHAFENTRPVSAQDYQKAIEAKTPEPIPDTFGGKLKAFLFGRKYGAKTYTTQQEEEQKQDPVSEAQMIKEMKNGIYFIKLVAPVISSENKIIPAGNYKITEEKLNGQPMLAFYQGRDKYGTLKLFRFEDNLKKEHELTYSRVDIVSDDIIRVVYSTIEDTMCAMAYVYSGN